MLQLGVTMDYSIFLLNCYEDNKKRFPGDKDRAMAHAISNTFKSVVGSSVTTIAGFVALCFMTFALGRDMGIVMAKGVVIGVICCVTLLPSMILLCDKAIEKTKHKTLLPSFDKVSDFITKHHLIWIAVFLVLLYPAIHGNNNVEVYYNIDTSLPASLPSNQANKELEEVFNMNTVHMVLMEKGLDGKEKSEMLKEIEDVDGVQWALGLNSFVGPSFPESMIPKDVRSLLESDNYELQFICSEYRSATDEVNGQISAIQDIVKKYSPKGMVIGEAPLMKDLADVTDVDLKNVNVISIAAIFVIIMIVFKSISLPFILVAVIEFAIFVNMAVPYYQGITFCCRHCNWCHTAWRHCGLCDSDDKPLSEREASGKRKERGDFHRAQNFDEVYYHKRLQLFCGNLRCRTLFTGRYDKLYLYSSFKGSCHQHRCSASGSSCHVYDF